MAWQYVAPNASYHVLDADHFAMLRKSGVAELASCLEMAITEVLR